MGRTFVALWAVGTSVVLASLMVSHWVALPQPTVERLDARGEAPALDGRWSVEHVLYADCGCSRRVLDHLLESERPSDVRESILLVGAAPELPRAARERGFALEILDEQELVARHGIEAAPLFVVIDPEGRTRYCGGYTERQRGLPFLDLPILARLVAGEDVPALPVYGCGVSAPLQARLDPLGLKY